MALRFGQRRGFILHIHDFRDAVQANVGREHRQVNVAVFRGRMHLVSCHFTIGCDRGAVLVLLNEDVLKRDLFRLTGRL